MLTKSKNNNQISSSRNSNSNLNKYDCKICGRKFAPDRINYHQQICIKTSQKKRKTFDMKKQRIQGTELEPFVKISAKKKIDKNIKPDVKSNWRRKHEEFIETIKSAKKLQAHIAAGGKLSDLPPPPPSDNSDYIQCPYCSRKFNKTAGERHIPLCKNMIHNKPNTNISNRRNKIK